MSSYKDFEIDKLINLARERDDSAFSEILTRYMPMMNKVICGFVTPLITYDEAYSEACVALHRAVLSYDFEKSDKITFGLYARICVYRRLLTLASGVKEETLRVDMDVDMLSAGANIEQCLVGRERMNEYLDAAKKLLSEYEYSVFLLYLDGASTAEISKKLGRDRKSVENAKSRMLKNLRRESSIFFDI